MKCHLEETWLTAELFVEICCWMEAFLEYLRHLCSLFWSRASLVAQLAKNLPVMWETWVLSLGWEDPLEKGKATHSSSLAWRIPWTVAHRVAKSRTRLSHFHFWRRLLRELRRLLKEVVMRIKKAKSNWNPSIPKSLIFPETFYLPPSLHKRL